MHIKRTLKFPTAALAAALALLLACDREPMTGPHPDAMFAELPSAEALPPTCGLAAEAPLLAGQTVEVGEFMVGNDSDNLYVSYQVHATSGWAMEKTHLDVGTEIGDIETNGAGNPKIGKFPYGAPFSPPALSWTETIPLEDLDVGAGDEVVIAAQAAMVHPDFGNETAWAHGESINDREQGGSWATYLTYEIQSCGQVEKVIGNDGGAVSGGGATLTIPQGALNQDVTVSITPVPEEELPEGPLPGTAVNLDAEGETFNTDVTLELSYDDQGLSPEEEARLSIYLLDEARNLWVKVPSELNPDLNTLTADLPHFSIYAVVPDLFRLEIRNVDPQPVPENEELDMQVWLWNESSGPLPTTPSPVITFTVVGEIDGWAYSTGQCNLASSGTTHTFTCDNIANIPDPGTAKVLSWSAAPAVGSAGTSIDASASAIVGTREIAIGEVSTNIDPPLTDADIDVFGEANPEIVAPGSPVQLTGHVVNEGPAHVDAISYRLGVEGDVALASAIPNECSPAVDEPAGGGFYWDCTTPPLPDNFGSTPMFTVTPQTAGDVSFTIEVIDVTGATDPFLGNNYFSLEIHVEPQPENLPL